MISNGNGPRAEPPRDRLTASTRPAQARATPPSVLGAARRRRQAAAARLVPLSCGCRDPLVCDLARWCPFWDGPRRHREAS
jgi:hypothetical protein